MVHRYAEYLDNFHIIVQQEKDRLAKLPEAERMEITLDNDATEQEVEHFLHGKSDENDMQ